MGQEQYRSGGSEGQRTEKQAPIEKDRANAKIQDRLKVNPAMTWKDSKPTPASKPT